MVKRVMFLFVYIVVCSVQANNGPIVTTAIGTIRGLRSEDGLYDMYLGIPYAKVNESNPFGKCIPHPDFEEIFEANDDSSMCPQIDQFNHTAVGDLDCLRVNIYTPTNVNSSSRLPVLVWIFGGKFIFGSYGRLKYGPKFLVRDDIIIVMVNYRLGLYGFMCLDIPEVPGNQGIKDQITALRWIKSHISAFGGDPDHITLGGHSSGAMCIDSYLHRDNTEENLFDKVILQSGTSLSILLNIPVKDAPIILAKYFDYDTDNIYAALDFLATVPPLELIRARELLGIAIDAVCIEKSFEGVENYLTTNWLLKKFIPAIDSIKVLIGVTDDEKGSEPPAKTISDLLAMRFNTQHTDFEGMSELVHHFYMGDEIIGADTFDSVVNITSDLSFVHPTYRTIYKYIENNAGDIYFYNFSYVGDRNFLRRRDGIKFGIGGAYHADELSYFFDVEFIPEKPTVDDQLVVDKMSKMWTNFVKYGDPTPELTELIDVIWEPIRRNSPIYSMNINTKFFLQTSPIADRITFWDVFYEKNGHLQWVL